MVQEVFEPYLQTAKQGRGGRDMKATTACMIVNCIAIIAFAVLAYLFGKWWIVLFAALFMVSTETKEEEGE